MAAQAPLILANNWSRMPYKTVYVQSLEYVHLHRNEDDDHGMYLNSPFEKVQEAYFVP